MQFSCYATLVIGAEQSGKTTFINHILDNFDTKRSACAVNMDPSTEKSFDFSIIDIRESCDFKDYLKQYGPKNALPTCMEFILQNEEWFDRCIFSKNVKYMLFYMPSEMDILLRVGVLPRLIQILHSVNCNVCIANLLDSQFVLDPMKFVGGYLYSMSMVSQMNVPHINILTKYDLLNEGQIQDLNRLYLSDDLKIIQYVSSLNPRFQKITSKIYALIRNYNFGAFILFDVADQASIKQCIKILNDKLMYIQDKDDDEEEEDNKDDDIDDHEEEIWPQFYRA